jgi:hypothetical protein
MSIIRVSPASVLSYGTEASSIFGEMHQSLTTLVNDVVNVHYFGPNAVSFKTECGRIAADFAKNLHTDMAAMADAVRASTSNIAQSLGGQTISITVESRTITPPVPPTVDYVDVDTSALSALTSTVNSRFTELNSGLDRNLKSLTATDWEGNAKTAAVDVVGRFTTSAKSKCTEAQNQINAYINKQVDAATTADK